MITVSKKEKRNLKHICNELQSKYQPIMEKLGAKITPPRLSESLHSFRDRWIHVCLAKKTSTNGLEQDEFFIEATAYNGNIFKPYVQILLSLVPTKQFKRGQSIEDYIRRTKNMDFQIEIEE